MGEQPVTVVIRDNGVAIEFGENAINCTIWLRHSEAERMAEFILVEQDVLDVSSQPKKGRHEFPGYIRKPS